jgi:hypothetical protein
MASAILAPGAPCSCRAGRYVRYVVPTVPGLVGFVSCRDSEAPRGEVREHGIPDGALIAIFTPDPGVARG